MQRWSQRKIETEFEVRELYTHACTIVKALSLDQGGDFVPNTPEQLVLL